VIAWLVPAWSVAWLCALGSFAVPVMSQVRQGIGETFVRMVSQTRISSRYRMQCRSGLLFSCRDGNPAWALLCPVWLCDLAGWFGCTAHAACLLNRLGRLPDD